MLFLKHLSGAVVASSTRSRTLVNNPLRSFCSSLSSDGTNFLYGLKWALAGRGVIVKDRAFYNLQPAELQKNGAIPAERVSGIPLHVRGNAISGASKISKAQFSKLLKQVTSHISSISAVFIQDGAVALSAKCDAKVRVISDNPSAMLSLSNILWEIPSRAVSHDSCPLTVYIANSISPSIMLALGLGTQAGNGLAIADIERSSLILCGKAFSDLNVIKDALAALAAPVISARGGLPLTARLLAIGDSLILLFASEDTIRTCPDLHQALLSLDAGVALSSDCVAPFFKRKDHVAPNLPKKPASLIIASSDSTGVLPLASKLSPSQAAYHFLAGYQDGKFVPAYIKGPTPFDPLALAKAFFSHLKDNEIPSFLINVNDGGKHITGKEIIRLATCSLSNDLPDRKAGVAESKVRDLKRKYKNFLSSEFQVLPDEFSF